MILPLLWAEPRPRCQLASDTPDVHETHDGGRPPKKQVKRQHPGYVPRHAITRSGTATTYEENNPLTLPEPSAHQSTTENRRPRRRKIRVVARLWRRSRRGFMPSSGRSSHPQIIRVAVGGPAASFAPSTPHGGYSEPSAARHLQAGETG